MEWISTLLQTLQSSSLLSSVAVWKLILWNNIVGENVSIPVLGFSHFRKFTSTLFALLFLQENEEREKEKESEREREEGFYTVRKVWMRGDLLHFRNKFLEWLVFVQRGISSQFSEWRKTVILFEILYVIYVRIHNSQEFLVHSVEMLPHRFVSHTEAETGILPKMVLQSKKPQLFAIYFC